MQESQYIYIRRLVPDLVRKAQDAFEKKKREEEKSLIKRVDRIIRDTRSVLGPDAED